FSRSAFGQFLQNMSGKGRVVFMAGLVAIATITGGVYRVQMIEEPEFAHNVDLDLLSEPLHSDHWLHEKNGPPPSGEPKTPIFPHFDQSSSPSMKDQGQNTGHTTTQQPQAIISLKDKEAHLEGVLKRAQGEQQIMDRILSLTLLIYAHKKGIAVNEISAEERKSLENEHHLEYISVHLDELSEISTERVLLRLAALEKELKKLDTGKNQQIPNHISNLFKAIIAGILFVIVF
ncbi:MAG: hypothetical protein OXC40_06735, partial [Proteobacteria bacterium]|nr:hypothetical protein [Pseudomonadota bacterium]